MNSRSHGALREFASADDHEQKSIELINDFLERWSTYFLMPGSTKLQELLG